jgi:hypothetical protein
MTAVQIYEDYDRIRPWYQAQYIFELANTSNLMEITEESKNAWIHAISLGHNLLKEDYEANRFNPSFTIDFQRFFYGYTHERMTRSYKEFIDYETINQLLTIYNSIIDKHRADNKLTTNICRYCDDYYCDGLCEDDKDRYRYRSRSDSW